MPNCANHPNAPAAARCAGCSEDFCGDCLVDIKGKQYCGGCKVMALGKQGTKGRVVREDKMEPCPEAGEALKYAIIGIFCFGIILGPIAVSKALKAKAMIRANPQLTGSGKATAAIIIGVIVCILWVLNIIARVTMR